MEVMIWLDDCLYIVTQRNNFNATYLRFFPLKAKHFMGKVLSYILCPKWHILPNTTT